MSCTDVPGDADGAPAGAGVGAPWPLPFLLVAAAASGVLLFLSYPPPDWGWLAFVAFVPLLVAVGRARSYRAAAACGGVTGLVAGLRALAWVSSVAVAGWVILALFLALNFAAAMLAVHWFQRRHRTLWPLPAATAWVALELARTRLGPGFSWLFLGYTQYRFGALLQVAAFGGVFAVGWIVFFVNASVASVVSSLVSGARASSRGRWALAAAAGLLLALCAALGAAVRARVVVRTGPVVGVVQQNVPRVVSEVYSPAKTAEDYYRERAVEVQLCAQLTARLRGRGVRLVAWPETTAPVPLDLPPAVFAVPQERELRVQTASYLRELGRDMGSYFLVGAPSYVSREAARSLLYGVEATPEFGNSALFLSPEAEVIDRYDKIKLVPFGEYVPWRDVLPFLQAFTPIPREITPGREEVVFELPADADGEVVRFAAPICYEDVFPDLCVAFRRRGARVLVNITDEGWYDVAGELRQHVAMAVFRAVETRTCVVRAANTGVSCFIGPRGEIYASLEPWTRGVLSAPLRLCDATTPYTRFGDAFAVLCLMLVIAVPAFQQALRPGR